MFDNVFEKAVRDLETNGIAVIPDFLTTDEIIEIKEEIKKIIAEDPVVPDKSMVDSTIEYNQLDWKFSSIDKSRLFYEREAFDETGRLKYSKYDSVYKVGYALHCLNPVFKRITFSDKVKKMLRKLGYVEPRVIQGMYINKNPHIGGPHLPHQDRTYLLVKGDNPREVGFWIPLEDATEENGCLWYIPGSHKTGLHREQILNPDKNGTPMIFTKPLPTYDEKSFVSAPIKKGGCVLIDGLVVHKSEPNRSKYGRPAYTFHLYDGSTATWDERNIWQPTKANPYPSAYDY